MIKNFTAADVTDQSKQVDSSKASKDPAMAKRLWDMSIEMTGVDPKI